MAKINKAKIRRDIAQELATKFINSGEEYTCRAVVFSFCNEDALNHAKRLLREGINLSQSNYPFTWAGNMKGMFLSSACDIVHAHYYPKG